MLLLDEPTNHLDAESVAWLERFLGEYPGTVIAVTHDRYFLDNVAGWILELDRGHGIPWQGNYSSWLEQKDAAPASSRRSRKPRARQRDQDGARVGAHESRRAAREGEGAARALRGAHVEGIPGAQRDERDLHSAGPAARRPRDRGRQDRQVVRRPRAVREPVVQPAAGRHRRRDRAERRGQDHAVPDARGPARARQRHDPQGQQRADRVRRPEPRHARRRQDRVGRNQRRPGHLARRHATRRRRAATSAASTSAARTNRRRSGCSRAASATACTSRRC